MTTEDKTIQSLDGQRFSQAVIAASQRVLEVQERLNRINVFPVPDGDTGTNMALTLKAVAQQAIAAQSDHLGQVCVELAETALLNSRGNSGAVLAQFFQGTADAFQGKASATLHDFTAAMDLAVKSAEKAFLEPIEGTILTVMRAWKDALRVAPHASSFLNMLKQAQTAANHALQETPKNLKALAKAGVVDAGGQGFVNMLEGVLRWLRTGHIEWAFGDEDDQIAPGNQPEHQEITYTFCTECLVQGEDMDATRLRELAHPFGDSLIVAGNSKTMRVHVHTDEPESLFKVLGEVGKLSRTKAQDMRAQQKETQSRVAIVTDSSCDLPLDFLVEHGIHVVPVSVTFGAKTYLDRVDITSDVIYQKMENEDLPTTSQPTAGSFLRAYELAAQNHSEILAILLSSTVSGTFQAGQVAAEMLLDKEPHMKVYTIDSKTSAGALGLLIKMAVSWLEESLPVGEVVERVEKLIPLTKIQITVHTMDYLIHGGRVSRLKGFLAKGLNRVPLLSLTPEGRIRSVATVRPDKGPERLLETVLSDIEHRQLEDLQIIISHAHAESTAQRLKQTILEQYPDAWIEVLPASPTVGTHVGPGACGIAYLGFPKGERPWQ